MYLSLEALRPTIRTSYPIAMKLINLVNSVLQMVSFPARIPESLIPSLLDLFISSDASIYSKLAFSDVVFSVSIDLPSTSKGLHSL